MKKVVLREKSGIWRIIGEEEGQPDVLAFDDEDGGPPIIFDLIKVFPRYLLFTESMSPPSGKFNEFNPAQV